MQESDNEYFLKFSRACGQALRKQMREMAEKVIDESGEKLTPEEREALIEKLTRVNPIHVW